MSSSPDNSSSPHVFFARGHGVEKNPGNKTYRQLIHNSHEAYKAANDRKSQTAIANNVISSIECAGGRFLAKPKKIQNTNISSDDCDPSSGAWTQVSSRSLMRKVKQSLRDCKPVSPNNKIKTRNVEEVEQQQEVQRQEEQQGQEDEYHMMHCTEHNSGSDHLQIHDAQSMNFEVMYNQTPDEQTDDSDSMSLSQDDLMNDLVVDHKEVGRNQFHNESIDIEEIKKICDNDMALTASTQAFPIDNPQDDKLVASEFAGMSSVETFHVSSDFTMSRNFRGTSLFLESKDPHRSMMDISEDIRIHRL